MSTSGAHSAVGPDTGRRWADVEQVHLDAHDGHAAALRGGGEPIPGDPTDS